MPTTSALRGDRTCKTVGAGSDWRRGSRWSVSSGRRVVSRDRAFDGVLAEPGQDRVERWQEADGRCGGPTSLPGSAPAGAETARGRLGAEVEQRILDARDRTNWGPMRLTVLIGRHRSTIWKVLERRGQSRGARPGVRRFKRFEWSQPGALLHIDAYKAPKFTQPGHKVTGDRAISSARGLGHTVVIAVQDDHTPPGLRRAAQH